jgi:Protein of unknown function (DUF2934)
MKSVAAASPSRQESPQPKPVSVPPQINVRPADKPPDSTAQTTFPSSTLEPESTVVPGEERIRRRAYELYVEDGYRDGSDQEHWFAAERELNGKNK